MSADWGNYIAFGLTKPITETAKPVDTTTFVPSENVKEWGKYLAKDIKVASSRKLDESKRQDTVHPTSKVPIFFDYYIARGLPKADESISQSVKSLKPLTGKPTVAWATYLATGVPTNTSRVYNEVKRQEVEKISSTLQVPMLWAHYLAKTMKQATELLTSAAASTEASKQYVAAETVQEYGKYIARGVPAKSASSSVTSAVPTTSSADATKAVSSVTPAVKIAAVAGPAIFYGTYISRGVPKTSGSSSAATETPSSVNPFTLVAPENEKEWGKYIAKGVSLPTTAPSRVSAPTVYPMVEKSNTPILWGDYVAKGKAAATATTTAVLPAVEKKKDMTVGHYLTHSLVPDTRVLTQINSVTANRPEVLATKKTTAATEGGVTWSNYIAVGVCNPKTTPTPVATTSTSTATPAAAPTATTETLSSLTGKILHAPSAILHSVAGALSPSKPHAAAVPAAIVTAPAETSKEVSSVAVSAPESTAVPVTAAPAETAATDAPVAVTKTSASSASTSAPTDTAAAMSDTSTTPPTTAEVDQKIASLGTKVKNLFSNIFGTGSSSSTDRSSVSGTSPERK